MSRAVVFIFLFYSTNLFAQINLTQGLIAYYPFSGNPNDASGNNHNGVPFNNPTLTTDKFGNSNSAYLFDGIDDFIQIANHPDFNPATGLSIALLFNPSQNGVQTLIGKIGYNAGIATQFQMAMDFAPYPGVLFGVNPFSNGCAGVPLNAAYVNTGGSISTNQWYCVVGTFENGTMKIYLNGLLIQTINSGITVLNQCSNADIQIGSWWTGDLQNFKGKIDEVRIYNRALNQQEVSSLCDITNSLCTGSLGDPVVNTTFGSGNNPAQPLPIQVPGATTNLGYVAVNGNPALPTPIDGQYTITNNTPFNNAWHAGFADHTPNDVNGYMAFYNSQETAGLEFYKQTVNNLCGSTSYEFAAWIANCVNPAFLNGVDPDITFRIERPDGTLLAFYNTGPISEETIFTWRQFGFFFVMPPNESTIVLKMINNAVGGTALPGNDLAIDDITFRPCGPTSDASFSNTVSVDTTVICAGSPVSLFGSLSPGFITPNHRWQVSTDDGQTWTDLPSANTLQLTLTPSPTNGKYFRYRMASGDGNNINSPNCRIVTNTLFLLVNDLPSGGIKADTVCKGTNGQLLFTATKGTGPFSISYSDPGNNFYNIASINSGSSFPTPTVINVSSTYILTSIKDANGCLSSNGFNPAQAIVGVKKGVFAAPPDKSVCENQPIQLTGNNGLGYSYSWSPGTFLSNPTIANPICTPATSTTYSVLITEPTCSYDSTFSVVVTANPNPVITAQKSNDIDCAVSTATLQATGADNYNWTPIASLSNAGIPNPIASPGVTTTYFVKGTNSFGCFDTTSITVKVTNGGRPIFVLPNAFTPNGDGKNDCFGIQRWGNVTIKEFSIFNRWGEKVFQTKNPTECWDGRFKGNLQPSGGYTYVIVASSFCGDIKKTGIIMLIR